MLLMTGIVDAVTNSSFSSETGGGRYRYFAVKSRWIRVLVVNGAERGGRCLTNHRKLFIPVLWRGHQTIWILNAR